MSGRNEFSAGSATSTQKPRARNTAGRLVIEALGDRRRRDGLSDSALAAVDLVRRYGENWRRPLELSAAGRHLAELGMSLDVMEAAKEDRYPVLPQFQERRIQVAAG